MFTLNFDKSSINQPVRHSNAFSSGYNEYSIKFFKNDKIFHESYNNNIDESLLI